MLEIHLDANTNLECCYKALTAPQIQIQGDLFFTGPPPKSKYRKVNLG